MANDTNNLPPETKLTAQGQVPSLTDKKLEQWFAALEKSNNNLATSQELEEDDEGLATQLISRFGIKGPVGVSTFLNSDEGKEITAMIREKLAEIEAMEDYEQFLATEENKREHKLLGFLLLALMYANDAGADSLNEIIAAQNEKRIQRAHDAATDTTPVNDAQIEHDILVEQNNAFRTAVEAVDEKLKVKNSELETVDKTLSTLTQQKQDLDAEHKVFDDHLTKLDDFLASTEKQANQPELIEQQIKSLQTKMDEQLEEIQGLIEKGQDNEARTKLKEHQGLHIQVAGLRDMQDVLKGQKHFCDAEGKPATSPKDAQLVLDIGKKIVKDPADGRCHLLAAHEDLQSIKSSANAQERLSASHGHYQQALAANSSVRAQVDTNKQLKQEHHLQRHSAALAQKATLQGDISLLSAQKTKLQADQIQVEKRLMESNRAKLSAPSETLTPNAIPTFRPQLQSTTNFAPKSDNLADAIKALKDDHSPAAIARVRELAKTHLNDPQFKSFANQIETIKNMPRTAPIPKIAMDNLLRTSGYSGVSAEKPNVTPLSAATLAKTPENTPDENTPEQTTTPTPTPTKLRPQR